MRGIWFTAKGVAAFQEEPEPELAPDRVLVRTIYSGLSNGTERNKLMGGNYHKGSYPDRIGYQHVSEVVGRGEGVTKFDVGDVVFSATYPGHVPMFTLKESDLVVKLEPAMRRPAATMMGVASVSMHVARISGVGVGDRVLVVGGGLIGQFAVQASRAMGARVTLVDRNADRLELARELGADHAVDNTDEAAWNILKDMPRFSVCLECSGGDVLDAVIGTGWGGGVLARGARMVFVAGRDRTDFSFNAASSCRLVTYSSAHFVQDDLDQVYRLATKGVIRLDELVRDVVPIDDAICVYDTLRDDKRKLLGTVFDWRQ